MKILAFDHNKDHLVDWTKAMMSKQSSSDNIETLQMSTYVDGMVCPVLWKIVPPHFYVRLFIGMEGLVTECLMEHTAMMLCQRLTF